MERLNFLPGTNYISHVMYLLFACIINNSCNEPGKINERQSLPGQTALPGRNIASIEKGKSLLANGDLLTRSDDDFESLGLQNFSKKDRTYSHSGIIFKEEDAWFVYHSMAGIENPDACILREPYDSFVNPLKKTGFGIFRYQLTPVEIIDLHTLYKKYYGEKLPFDKSFNLNNDDSMYCSEIIFKSLKKVTGNRVILPTSSLTNFKPKTTGMRFKNTFFKKFDYVGLDDLYLNPFCTKIFSAQYK